MAYHYHYGVPPAGYRPFYDSRATSPPFSSNNEYVYYAPGQGLLDTSSTTTNTRLRRTLRKARRRCASLYDSITDAYGTDDKVMGDPWLRLGDLDWVLKRLQMITYDTSRMPVLLPIQDSLHKCAETLKRLKVLVDAYDRTFEPGLAGWTGRRAWKSRTAEFEDLQDFLGLCKDSFEGAVKLGEMLQRTQQQPVVAQKDTISAQVGSVPGNLSSAASAVAGSVSIGTDRGYALKKYLLDDTSIQAWSDQPAHSNKEDASSASDWDDSTSEKSNDNHKDAAMVTSAFQLGRASNLPRGLPGKSRETIRSAGGGSDAFSGSIVPPPYRLENPIETQKTFQSDPTYEDNPIVDVDQLSKTRQRDEVGIEHDLEESQVHFDPSQHCPQCHSGVIGQQYQDRKCSGCGWKGHRLSLPASMNPQDTSKRTASPKGKTRTFGGIEIHYDNSGEPVDSGKVVETKAIMNENDRRVEDDTESRDTKSDASDSDDENPRSIGGGADAQTVKKTIFKGPDFRDSFPTNYIDARSLKHMLTVKAAHAAPTVDVDVDDSNDGGIDWQRVRDRDESLGEQGQAYELEEQQQKYRKSLFTLTNPEEGSDSEVEATQVGGQDTAPTSPAIEEKPPLMTETLKGSSSSESTKTSHYPTTLQEAATDDEVETFQDYYSFVSFSRNSLVYTLFKYKDGVHDESTPERGDIIKITRMWNQRDKYGGEIWASGLKLVGVSATSPAEKIAKAAAADQGMGALTTFPLPSVCSPEKWATKVQE